MLKSLLRLIREERCIKIRHEDEGVWLFEISVANVWSITRNLERWVLRMTI